MPYNATHRRNLSAPGPKTAMDPTPLKHHPDPSTTIQDISTHFSRLYLNHKARAFLKSSTQPLPHIGIHLQAESTAASIVSNGSTAAFLTKSQSQRSRGNPRYIEEEPQEQEESIKKAIVISNKEPTKNVKGYANLMPENKEKGGGGEARKLQQGYEVKRQYLPWIGMDRGRRRSFGCSSQVEVADFLACNGAKLVSADMPPFMQIHAVDVTRKTYDSLEKFTAKSLALILKKEFDGVYGPAWHCIVGFSFGSFVTHSVGGFLYFSMDQKLFVLLFKTTVQRAH